MATHEYDPGGLAAYNATLDRVLRRFKHMDLARWKLLRSTVLSAGILAFGGYAISQGAPPGQTMILSLVIVASLVGVDAAEWLAVAAEVKRQASESHEDE
jgi:hypothetical protein